MKFGSKFEERIYNLLCKNNLKPLETQYTVKITKLQKHRVDFRYATFVLECKGLAFMGRTDPRWPTVKLLYKEFNPVPLMVVNQKPTTRTKRIEWISNSELTEEAKRVKAVLELHLRG